MLSLAISCPEIPWLIGTMLCQHQFKGYFSQLQACREYLARIQLKLYPWNTEVHMHGYIEAIYTIDQAQFQDGG